jgi:hypothetical protein
MTLKGRLCGISWLFRIIFLTISTSITLFAQDNVHKKDTWYLTCRPHLEWVNWDSNLNVEKYTDELIARAKKLNSDTLVYPWESGGYLLYPGMLAPQYEPLKGQDLIETLAFKAHKAGLKFVICFLGMSANTYCTTAHPDWIQIDANGTPIRQWPGYYFRSMCPNSPYSDYLYDVACDLLKRYKIDGIYLEGIYVAGSGFCHCKYCEDFFKKRFGRDIPTENYQFDNQYTEYRQVSAAKIFEKIRKAIDDVSPNTILFSCMGGVPWYSNGAFSVRDISPYSDVLSLEAQWGAELPISLSENGLVMRMIAGEGQLPTLGTVWINHHVDFNFSPRPAANIILNFVELLFHGSIVQAHTQNGLEVESSLMPILSRLYTIAEKLNPYMADSNLMAHAAILNWANPRDLSKYFDKSMRGSYTAMIENHIPCDVVTIERLLADKKHNFNVLILPEALDINEAAQDKIVKFVENGGGLVITGKTIINSSRLAFLAGVQLTETIPSSEDFPKHTYYRINSVQPQWKDLTGVLLSFNGGRERITPLNDTQVLAKIVDFDKSRMSEKHIVKVCFPGNENDPLITIKKAGKGTVVYIAADLASPARDGSLQATDVLAAAVKSAGSEQIPIKTNCPPSVEIVTHLKPQSIAVLLINGTTNQRHSSYINYVVPISDAEVELKLERKPKKISTLTGQKVKMTSNGKTFKFHIKKLSEYEGILLNF